MRKRPPRKENKSSPTRFRSPGALTQVRAPLLFHLNNRGEGDSLRSLPPVLLLLLSAILPARARADIERAAAPSSLPRRKVLQLEASVAARGLSALPSA